MQLKQLNEFLNLNSNLPHLQDVSDAKEYMIAINAITSTVTPDNIDQLMVDDLDDLTDIISQLEFYTESLLSVLESKLVLRDE
jgi:hypothetical protein